MTRVKICGVAHPADALAATEAGADFVGLVFAPSAPPHRLLTAERALEIVLALGTPLREMEQPAPPPVYHGPEDDLVAWFRHGAEALERLLARKRPLTVGVFADQPLDLVDAIAEEAQLDLVQLSGWESWADCLLVNRQVIKAVHTRELESGEEVLAMMEPGTAIACLLDESSGRGVRGDWRVAAEVASRLPVILAGGLDPTNVAEAVRAVRPWGVDVSSGVETEGRKDPAKIAAFVRAAKGVSGS